MARFDPAAPAAQADILRDITRHPFQPFLNLDPARGARSDGAVCTLARSVYEHRSFDRLPLLADALHDAGCTDAELLAHLRGPGPHVRGCWAVDFILNKT
jgi:hypothetical protein